MRLIKTKSVYSQVTLFAAICLFLSFCAKGENNNYSAQDTNTTIQKISCIVVNNEGTPISGLALRLYSDPEQYPKLIYASGITGEDGSFEFVTLKGESYLLELQGDHGKGRVFISAENQDESIGITYPVVEKIVFLHTNDQHFTVNNPNEFGATVTQIREKYDNVFLFSAGDIFVRHPLRWIVNGRLMRDPEWYGERTMYMINTMNDFKYDLMTLGNHEFDYREPYTRNALDAARFPLLAANMEITTENMSSLDAYAVLKTSTWRNIAVLGLSTGGSTGIKELDINKIVNNYLSLRDSSDIFVALTHIGLKKDYALANDFPQFDVIIGGHSHDLLDEAVLVNSVLIAQAGGNPHIVSDLHPVYLGKIVLTLENGIIRNKTSWIIEIKAMGKAEAESGAEVMFEEELEAVEMY